MKRSFGLTLLALALAVVPAQAQFKITCGNSNKMPVGPWYLYYPLEAYFQVPASPQYPYWPAPMSLPVNPPGGQAAGGYNPYGATGGTAMPTAGTNGYNPYGMGGYNTYGAMNPYQAAPALPAGGYPNQSAPTIRTGN